MFTYAGNDTAERECGIVKGFSSRRLPIVWGYSSLTSPDLWDRWGFLDHRGGGCSFKVSQMKQIARSRAGREAFWRGMDDNGCKLKVLHHLRYWDRSAVGESVGIVNVRLNHIVMRWFLSPLFVLFIYVCRVCFAAEIVFSLGVRFSSFPCQRCSLLWYLTNPTGWSVFE